MYKEPFLLVCPESTEYSEDSAEKKEVYVIKLFVTLSSGIAFMNVYLWKHHNLHTYVGPYLAWCHGVGSAGAAWYGWPPPLLNRGSSSAADPLWVDWWPRPSAAQMPSSADQGSSPGLAPGRNAWPGCSPLVCPPEGVPACGSAGRETRKNWIKRKLHCERQK